MGCTDSVLSGHPGLQSSVRPESDPRSRPSAPCDIKADTSMVSSKIDLDISFNKTPLLQEFHCLNTKIIKVEDVKVSEVDVEGVVDFVEARLHQGVEAAHPHTVPIVKPLGVAHQGLCQTQECDGEVSSPVPNSSVVCLGSMMPSALVAFWETAVVGDTGATVAIIGEDHAHLAENIRLLDIPVSVSTASGGIELTHAGDLPGCFGLMDGAFLNHKCKHSLCPVVKRCEDLGVGFTVSEGASSASFHKGGKTLVDLDVSSGLPTFSVGSRPGSLTLTAKSAFMTLAYIVTGTAASADYHDHTSLVLAKQSSWMLQHDLDGHRPARSDCTYCKQASLRQTRAFRVPRSHRTEKSCYHLAGDFSDPHPPSVDGQTYAFIGVEFAISWGFVWLQNSRSATDTLVSLKEFVRQLSVTAGIAVQSVFSWHHDDDKSFRGPVEMYVQSQGWTNTHTGGYRPNANSLVERRVGMLH